MRAVNGYLVASVVEYIMKKAQPAAAEQGTRRNQVKRTVRKSIAMVLALVIAVTVFSFGTGSAYAEETYRFTFPRTIYTDTGYPGYVCKDVDGDFIYPIKVTSDNPKVLKVLKTEIGVTEGGEDMKIIKVFDLEPKKPGKATITAVFRDENGKKQRIERTIRVREYPVCIKNLTVNGKKVSLKKQGGTVYSRFSKKTYQTVKFAMKKGWSKVEVDGKFVKKNGDAVSLTKKQISRIKKGKSIKFPKKYKELDIMFHSEKGEDYMDFLVEIMR